MDASISESIIDLVVEIGDGTLDRQEVVAAATLRDLGISSLSYLRLIDAIENNFGVYIDLEKGGFDSVEKFAEFISASTAAQQ